MAKQNKKLNGQSALQSGHQPPVPTPELLERFLDVQQHELQVRAQELALHAKQEDNQKSIAETSISANLQDRESERAHRERASKIILRFLIIIVIIFTFFAGLALYAGKEAIVMKMVEIVAAFAAGFTGGYGFKSAKDSKKKDIKD